jgi:hydrogenase-4 component B
MLEILFPLGLAAFIFAIILSFASLKLGNSKVPRQISLISTCVASVVILAFALEIIFSNKNFSFLAYPITYSFQFSFLIDRLAAFFLALVAVVSLAVAIYSVQYIEHTTHEGRKNLIVGLMNIFIVSMMLVIASFSMFSFLFFWEIMALSSFLLVMVEFEKKETQKAGIFYFVMTHLSTLFLLFAFIFIYTITGAFDITQIRADPLITSIAFVFLFLVLA